MKLQFHNSASGDFSAAKMAEKHLSMHGYSFGSACRDEPRGILKGDYLIAKWRNLTHQERKELHGVMTGDQRNGPITIEIYDGAEVSA